MSVRKYFLGDFYPLVSYSLDDDVWAAWQFDRPDLGEGMVLALRRPTSPFAAMIPRLQHLDPDAEYDVRDADTSHTQRFVGRVLCESGLQIEIRDQPGSRLLVYKRIH
jgi:alpha-galactosidase